MSAKVDHRADKLEDIVRTAGDRERAQKIIDSLDYLDRLHRGIQIPEAHAATLQWLFTAAERNQVASNLTDDQMEASIMLRDWLKSEHQNDADRLFWVEGRPGSGKSCLMKFIATHANTQRYLQDWAGTNIVLTAQHFFWDPGSLMQNSIQGCLQNILYQLLSAEPNLIPLACPRRWKSPQGAASPWTQSEISEAISQGVKLFSGRVCLFIDGLDECKPETHHGDFLTQLIGLSTQTHLKMMVSSRPWPRFQRAFRSSNYSLTMHQVNEADVQLYVEAKITRAMHVQNADTAWSDDCSNALTQPCGYASGRGQGVAESLITTIVEKAEGVFLWVDLVVNDACEGIEEGQKPSSVWGFVDHCPSELAFLRKMIVDRIPRHSKTTFSETATVLALYLAMLPSMDVLDLFIDDHHTHRRDFEFVWLLARAFGYCDDESPSILSSEFLLASVVCVRPEQK
jgi:hypothetical protein